MSIRFKQKRDALFNRFYRENIQISTLNSVPFESFLPIFEQEKENFIKFLDWDISRYAEDKSRLIKNKSLFGSCLIKDRKIIAYIIILPMLDFLYLNSMNTLNEHKDKGYLEDLLALVCAEIQQNDPVAIEGQPFIFGHLLEMDRFSIYGKNVLIRTFMVNDIIDKEYNLKSIESISFRPLNASYHALAEVLIESYKGHPESNICSFYNGTSIAMFYLEDLIEHGGCGNYIRDASYCACIEQKLIGFIISTEISKRHGHIAQVVLKKNYHQRGIGTMMLNKALLAMQKKGFSKVSLSVTKDIYTYEWYSRSGFRPVMDYVGFRFRGAIR